MGWRALGPAFFLGGFGARQLAGIQASRLFHDSHGFFPSPGYTADALWVADLVVLKALWRIGELDRTHLIAPDPQPYAHQAGFSLHPDEYPQMGMFLANGVSAAPQWSDANRQIQ